MKKHKESINEKQNKFDYIVHCQENDLAINYNQDLLRYLATIW
jgi:hypothetical protein